MWLEVLSGEDAGRVVELPPDESFVLGRVQGADLVVRDPRASRLHAELTPEPDGGVRLVDLDSANGTLVDGAPVREAVLRGGEEIAIGAVRIAVLEHEPPVTGAPVPEPVRAGAAPPPPTWSMVGRLVEQSARRGRRATAAGLAVAGVAVGALAVLLATGTVGGDSEEDRVAAVVRAATPATVPVGASGDAGSGWVRPDGLVVTAAHVLAGGPEATVSGRPATVLGVAPCEDLALLRPAPDAAAPGAALRPAGDAPEAGETVLAFGFPETTVPGEPASSTRGVVSAPRTGLRDPAPDVPAYPTAIRTDTALDPGFSGGPLLDLDGRVVGINAAARTEGADGRPLQAASYAVAADRAERVLRVLRSGRSPGWIGAGFGYPTVEELAEARLPPGVRVRWVAPKGAAADAGLQPGDLIVAVDGRAVGATLAGWCRAVRRLPGGASAELRLLRDAGDARGGRERTARVRVG